VPGSKSSVDDATVVVDATDLSWSEPANAGGVEPVTIGARLGRYLVIEELGRGGMGLVLHAYDPKLQREVALKIVRTGALDASAQARLVREARAMARLNHPNVVAVYDVELEDAVVVVMEYVPGTTLWRWLDEATRSWKEVVDAFLAAGRGLAAAHDEGLLHRDFKPDNVLVGSDARVRVTDFGLARAHGGRASFDAAHARHPQWSSEDGLPSEDEPPLELTDAGMVMGTPRYMAPEQAEGKEVDARADQYAFCVALWRALTGRWPFEGNARALLQAKRAGAPHWPNDVAVPRHVVEAVRRGLSADPASRWPSVPALLAELSRDPSRRRRRLLATGVLALAVVGGWGLERLQRARTMAGCASEGARIDEVWNDARADTIDTAFAATGIAYAGDTWRRSHARIDDFVRKWKITRSSTCEREIVERTLGRDVAKLSRACLDEHYDALDALLQQLEQPDATVIQQAATATASLPLVRACTDENRLRHRTELPSDPGMRERVRDLRGRLSQASAAQATGRHGLALQHAQAVLEEAMSLPWAPLATEAKLAVAVAHDVQGRYEDARGRYEEVFVEAGASARDELALRASTALVDTVGARLARPEEGLHWGRLSRMLVDRLDLPDDLAVAELLNNLANVHASMGVFDEAQALHEKALAIREKELGPEHPKLAASLNNFATVRYGVGAFEDARILLERAVAIRQRALGPEHPSVASNLSNLATVHQTMNELDDAKALHERALAIQERTLGLEHPDVAMSLNNLAALYRVMGAYDEAKSIHERAIVIREKTLGPEHPDVAVSLNNLGSVHQSTSTFEEAKALHERALRIQEKTLGPEHLDVATSLYNLGNVHRATGAYEDAKSFYERAVTVWEQALGPEHADVAESLCELARVHVATGAYAEAKACYERALAIWEKAPDREHADGADAAAGLAEVEARLRERRGTRGVGPP
jgi:eukaryotic-like serine/threonine-protein kinase